MRCIASSVVLGALLVLALPAARSEAWVRGGHWHHPWGGPRVIVGIGPVFGWGFYAPPPYYVVTPPAASAWYYCQSAHAYYPQVPTCPEPWVQVPPTPQ
jgi:hypothetical protein